MSEPTPSPENLEPGEDDEAMRQIASGESDAMESIFKRWKLPLLSFFYRATGSHADAEDLTLKTLDRLYRSASRYQNQGRFGPWLFAIARRELSHEWRRLKRKPVRCAPPELLADSLIDHSDGEIRRAMETEEQLLVALRLCSDREREALLLAASDRLDSAGIASALGVKERHLHVILHRARKTLKEAFDSLFS